MVKDYRFKEIEKYLKKDNEIGDEILDAFSSLADAAIIFSPVILGPQFLPLLELLEVKDRLVNLGKKVNQYIVGKVERDYIDRTEQIRAAYALICYTAYFDALRDTIPKSALSKLKKRFQTELENNNHSIHVAENSQVSYELDVHFNVYYADHNTSFNWIKKDLHKFYVSITQKLILMIKESAIYDVKNEKEKKELESLKKELEKIPSKAIEVYESQYVKLADEFNDFALFAQLNNFDNIHQALEINKNAMDKLLEYTNKIDVGLCNLNEVVNLVKTDYKSIDAQDIVDDLKQRYNSFIEEPIIDDKEIKPNSEKLSIKFPKIIDAFIPQSYKSLCYSDGIKLEDESLWNKQEKHSDLDKFFVKYLYSPDSIDYPLIILGHPGSGKSLLTKVLSAQLMSNSYTVVRIPLRDVNAESGIDVLVEDQIKKLTNRNILTQGYGGFASCFNEKPLVIILDGYDELLQAKGDVFSGYLEKVRVFQQDQKSMKRPVRIIITSRITLIDKARIPEMSTVLRLMEFNSEQREAWINIWNGINAEYYNNSGIKPFCLPPKIKGKKSNVIELAEQPLLLLMLALYDSEGNELAKTNEIKRTELYDNLLRRFVRRERSRYINGFIDKDQNEQEQIIEQEMNRLGVVAIGMYNRKEVVILSKQLETDLDTFNARRRDGSPRAHTLKESESVLGGFFFIHQSIAKDVEANTDNYDSAYEFLHNTFGEFLAADFILRNTINEVIEIFVGRKFNTTGMINNQSEPKTPKEIWFHCLMYVPLYSRPVVIEMLREHAQISLERIQKIYNIPIRMTNEEFLDNFKILVKSQLKMILNTRNIPSVMLGDAKLDQDMPLLGHLATYSLNLIIIACTLSPNGFEFNEKEYIQHKGDLVDARQWEKLSSLWKAWFSPEDLMGLSVVLKAKRIAKDSVCVASNNMFGATRYEQPIDIMLCVSSTLADDLNVGLAGLQTEHFEEITGMSTEQICEFLKRKSMDMYLVYAISLIKKLVNSLEDNGIIKVDYYDEYMQLNSIVESIVALEDIDCVGNHIMLDFFETLEYCLMKNMIFISTRRKITKYLECLEKKYYSHYDTPKFMAISNCVKRLFSLLISNTNYVIYDRYREPYLNYFNVGEKWGDNVFYTRSTRKIGNSKIIKANNIVNSYNYTDSSNELEYIETLWGQEKKKIYKSFFSIDNIDFLLNLNPRLLSQVLLLCFYDNEISREHKKEIGEKYFRRIIESLFEKGISFFDLDAIINTLIAAKYIDNRYVLEDITNIIKHELFDRYARAFSYIAYEYPGFVFKLLDILPDYFYDLHVEEIDTYYFEKNIRYVSNIKMFEYIKVFRAIYILAKRRNRRMGGIVSIIESILVRANIFEQKEYRNVTIEDIGNLKWCAKLLEDKEILDRVNKYIEGYLAFNKKILDVLEELK